MVWLVLGPFFLTNSELCHTVGATLVVSVFILNDVLIKKTNVF